MGVLKREFGNEVKSTDAGGWNVVGYVKTKNAFGVRSRLKFSVILGKLDGKWKELFTLLMEGKRVVYQTSGGEFKELLESLDDG
jgi:hypothetical protein